MAVQNEKFLRATLRHFAVMRDPAVDGPQAVPMPKGWFDLPADVLADFGAMMYLASLNPYHRELNFAGVAALLEPPLRLQQYRVFRSDGFPRAFITWAGLDAGAERRLAVDHLPLQPEDWNRGHSTWLIDFVAPFGHIDQIVPLLTRNPAETCVRTLWHNKQGTRYRIVEWSRPQPAAEVEVRSYGVGQFARLLEGVG